MFVTWCEKVCGTHSFINAFAVVELVRQPATRWKDEGSIPDGVVRLFH